MSTFETAVIIAILILFLGVIWILTEISTLKKKEEKNHPDNIDTKRLQLQAYERLALVVERISLPHMISRTNSQGLSYREMQLILCESIRQEFEYNISQQIYVSVEIWKAVNDLKEQNIYIINQVASTLSSRASGLDLNKKLVEFIANNPKASLHQLVGDAINYEAKKLMR